MAAEIADLNTIVCGRFDAKTISIRNSKLFLNDLLMSCVIFCWLTDGTRP